MFYQVTANLYFDTQDEAADFYHDCELAYLKSTICNPDTKASEYGVIQLIENHHDEDPNGPCYLVSAQSNEPPDSD